MDDKAKEAASGQLDLQDFNGSEVKQYLEDLFKGRRAGEVKQPDNSIELSSEEFDRFNQDTKQWVLDNIISKNKNYTYLGILEVKNGNFQAFQKENMAFSVNPVIRLSGIILKYYLVVKVIPNKIRNKIKMEASHNA